MKSAFNAKVASTEFSVKLVENALVRSRNRLNFKLLNFQRLNGEPLNANSKRHLSSIRPFRPSGAPALRPLLARNPFSSIQQLKIDRRHLTIKMDLNNNKENFARILWRSADCVCFDVDSTVCRDEAIDELARFAGKEKQVQEL